MKCVKARNATLKSSFEWVCGQPKLLWRVASTSGKSVSKFLHWDRRCPRYVLLYKIATPWSHVACTSLGMTVKNKNCIYIIYIIYCNNIYIGCRTIYSILGWNKKASNILGTTNSINSIAQECRSEVKQLSCKIHNFIRFNLFHYISLRTLLLLNGFSRMDSWINSQGVDPLCPGWRVWIGPQIPQMI